ncbi:MAG: hypothetical protein JGK10_07465 [Microcoleus sp. PH2017_13_LAR_U_A]|nr:MULTISPECIES: tyrosine-type recombinase/integrase [unclassified Microcoleus]MCC3471652.1 hypothetical protein [Microcoleus sp. PH2017_13_LAR_U_A]MCC3622286.1 hypothetical protein [Microcoleus sp. PH2017_36_ELK_O_B]
MKDTPENFQKAIAIAWRIEEDLQHSDWQKLFDPTFAKYGLKTKYAAELKLATPIPDPGPEMTVGTMWEDYLIWKQPQLQPTTFENNFLKTYTNIVKGFKWNNKQQTFSETQYSIWDMPISHAESETLLKSDRSLVQKKATLVALSEAFIRLQSLGKTKLAVNPFVIVGGVTENKTNKYKPTVNDDGSTDLRWWDSVDKETDSEERDRRAFVRDERDTIINAFYEHKNAAPRLLAPLVEFRFLTGCRSGEAFALEWKDVFLGRNKDYIRFSKSYNGRCKNMQVPKTGETRIFKIYPKLSEFLNRIKPADAKPTDLVFVKLNGRSWDNNSVKDVWNGKSSGSGGVVTQLAADGLINGYLPFYSCRHTFITLMAHSGADLLLLATACGNSIEVIQRHYLGVDTTANFPNI